MHLIATRAIKKGDQITVAYVDVSQRPGESVLAARQRRRQELARGWRFACQCERCVADGADGTDSDLEKKDGSRLEEIVTKIESHLVSGGGWAVS